MELQASSLIHSLLLHCKVRKGLTCAVVCFLYFSGYKPEYSRRSTTKSLALLVNKATGRWSVFVPMLRWTLGHGVVLDLRVISSWTELDVGQNWIQDLSEPWAHWAVIGKVKQKIYIAMNNLKLLSLPRQISNSNLRRRTSRSLTSSNSNSGKVLYLWPKFLSPIPECP